MKMDDMEQVQLEWTPDSGNNGFITLQKLLKIPKTTVTVRKLVFHAVRATPEDFCQMFEKINGLTELVVWDQRKKNRKRCMLDSALFDDAVLKSVVKNCVNLKHLIIDGSEVSDEGLLCLANSSIRLLSLDVSGTRVTYASLEKLISSPTSQTLTKLFFGETAITGREKIASILLGFKKLEYYQIPNLFSEDEEWISSWKKDVWKKELDIQKRKMPTRFKIYF